VRARPLSLDGDPLVNPRQIRALFFFVAGCAFLTYYSRDSAISAQSALHEKRTLPGVSVYNACCGSLPTFQPIILE